MISFSYFIEVLATGVALVYEIISFFNLALVYEIIIIYFQFSPLAQYY